MIFQGSPPRHSKKMNKISLIAFSILYTASSLAVEGALDPFPRTTLKQVQFTGGTAGASSVYDTSGRYSAANAFLRDSDVYWNSGRDATGNGAYIKTPFPHLLWYEFPTAFIPGRVSFRPCPVKDCVPEHHWAGARKWQFIATNDAVCDENSAWTILCEDLSGKHFESEWQTKYCVADPNVNEEFRCVGISVLDGSYPRSVISGVRMWEKIVKNKPNYG